MSTALIYDDRFRTHLTGPGHPERPERLEAVVRRLKADGLWPGLEHLKVESADLAWVQKTHTAAYTTRLRDACAGGLPCIDVPDSAICRQSYAVAVLAAGGLLAAADAVVDGRVLNAFCAVRPPGHHAEADRSMGFCLLNNAAITADYLIARHGLERVAIVDFDVHHGNGTQHIFEHRDDVLYVSVHENPVTCYPGTGFADETGTGAGEGYTLNLPLDPGSGDDDYRRLITGKVLPALDRFEPDALVVSAGFDAAVGDPLAHMRVTAEGFYWITGQLVSAAEKHCLGRLVSTLEGGYDLDALAANVSEHVQALTGAG